MADLIGSFNQLEFERPGGGAGAGLGAIEEGSEEEDESDEEGGIEFDRKASAPEHDVYQNVHHSHFPQAFSHYTYEKSKKKLMVVDLQGVFEERKDRTSQFVLTDPVIHKRKHGKQKQLTQWTFGRTGRGEKGMKASSRLTNAVKSVAFLVSKGNTRCPELIVLVRLSGTNELNYCNFVSVSSCL